MAVYEKCFAKEKRQKLKKKLKYFIDTRAVAAALLLVFFFVQFLGSGVISASGLELEVSVSLWGGGKTILNIPPVGSITAPTHLPPLDFNFTLNSIDLDLLAGSGEMHSGSNIWLESMAGELMKGMLQYVLYLLLFSFLIGVLTSLLESAVLPRKKKSPVTVIASGLVVSIVLLSCFAVAAASYDPGKFSEAEFEGILESAPYVAGVLEDGAALVEDLQGSFDGISRNLGELQGKFGEGAQAYEAGENSLTLMHVSDVHNNPAAFSFIHQALDHYEVDLIVDTGDLVDYGTELEMNFLINYLEKIDLPYIFVPGNHESPGAVRAIEKIENVTVLERDIAEVKGLKIAGLADPAAYSMEMAVFGEEVLEEAALELAELSSEGEEKVDVIAAHNPELFKYVRGDNNLLLGGHIHSPYVDYENDYIEINAGTTGASGIRGIENKKLDFSLAVVQFQFIEEENKYEPLSTDLIVVKQAPAGLKFEHFVFQEN